MDKDDIVAAVEGAVRRKLGGEYSIELIGSRARGSARTGSDYDFLIHGPKAISITTLAELRTDLDDLPTLVKIDLVDAATANTDFLAVAQSK